MRRMRLATFTAVGVTAMLALAGCGSSGGTASGTNPSSSGSGVCAGVDTSGTDELAAVCKAGKIVVSTDPAYPPQSSLNEQTNTYEGFDIDVATEVAKRLGVEVAWETPAWEAITAGGWNGRWDMSVGSMTVTDERAKVLNFTDPYYYTPASIAVYKDNTTINDLTTDLDGKTIGVCSGCTYEAFLNKTLQIPGFTFDFVVDNAKVVGYDTDTTAIQDLALGDGKRLDAVMSSITTLQGAIDSGSPIKIVGNPLFYEPLAAAFDRKADSQTLRDAVNKVIGEMHQDGTLTAMSKKWYNGIDLTVTTPSGS